MFAPGGPSPYSLEPRPAQSWRLRDGTPLPGAVGGSYKSAREARRRALILGALLLLAAPIYFLAGGGRGGRGAQAAGAGTGHGRRPAFQAGQNSFRVGIIADMDTASKCERGWCSVLKHITLARDPATGAWSASWKDDDVVLRSAYNEAGRGMELSELVYFNDRLLTFDDRTGIVFEVAEGQGEVVARAILTEGDGRAAKGMKIEWAAVRGDRLWLGSHGREWTDRSDGSKILGHAPEWVVSIDSEWRVERHDWTKKYQALRAATGHAFPGYLIHEAAGWSEAAGRWVFLPRRASTELYDDEKDERKGTNLLITADDSFTDIRAVRVGALEHPTRGFASFKFVPGRPDVIAALRSEEDAAAGTAATYVTVFDVEGRVLLPDTLVARHKFEGLEFLE